MKKSTLVLLPALALLAAASAQAQTTNIINTAYGPATIGSGTTSLITNGASITGAITDNGQLLFNRSSSAITNNYAISGAGSVTVASGSTVTLTASNSFAGPLTANNISGANYSAAPTLILSNALGNTIQGNLAVGNATSGTVTVGAYASNQFGSNSVLVFNSIASGGGNAAYFVMHANQTVAGLSGSLGGAGGAIEVNQYGDSANYGSQTLTVNVAAGTNYTLNGGSGGSGNIRNTDNGGSSVLTLVKNGDGIQTLTNINISQTGGTIVNAGSLVVQGSAADSANITLNGGTMKLSGAAAIAAYSGTNVTIGSGATFQLHGFDADNGTSSGTMQGNAEFGGNSSSGSPLVISGAGTWLFTGASTNNVIELGNNNGNSLKINMAQGGLINVASGTLRSGGYSSPDWTSNKASLNVATGAVFELWDGNRPVTVDSLTGGGLIGNALGNNAVTLNVGAANGSGTFSGQIANNIIGATGNTTSLTKLGTGTQVLSGTNIYSGITTVGAGVLEFANTNSLYNAQSGSWTANNFAVSNGATLAFAVGNSNAFSTSNITTILPGLSGSSGKGFLAGSSIGLDTALGNFSLTNNLTNSANGALGLSSFGGNTLTVTGNNSYTGTTLISSGTTLQVGNGGATGTLGSGTITDNGSLLFNRSGGLVFNSSITGSGAVSQVGIGTTTLNGSTSYTGSTTVSAGALVYSYASPIPLLAIDNGAGHSTNLIINGGALTSYSTTIGNNSNSVGFATVSSGSLSNASTLTVGDSGTGYLSITGGTVANNNGYIATSAGSAGAVSISSGLWSNNNLLTVGNNGIGTLSISGNGTVTIGNGSGTLKMGFGSTSTGTLNLGDGGSSMGSLLAAEVTGGSGTATVNVNSSGDNTLGQKFSGSLSFNQIGSGTTTLTGSNSYTGTTTVSAGTLNIGNSGTGNLVIDSGAGHSTNLLVNGGTLNNASGIIGNAVGTVGSVTVTSGSWNNSSFLYIGYYGSSSNSLTISNGGTVRVAGSVRWLGLGEGGGSANTLTVTGSNSTLFVHPGSGGYGIWIGDGYDGDVVASSSNTMVVSAGGKVYSGGQSGIGGSGAGVGNTVLVTGTGSLWSNNGALNIGGAYQGSTSEGALTVTKGGSVVANNIYIAKNAGTVGVLNIGTFGGNDAAGTLTASTIQFGNGTGTINFNQSTTTTIASAISGSGKVNQLGSGTTILSGLNSYTGGTVISAGTLATLGNERLANTGDVTVNSGATFKLGGNETIGSLSGAGTANVGANNLTLSSGNFSGALAGSGDLYKTGADAFTLSGTSAGFTGDLYLQGGSVVAGSSTALNANNFVLLSAGSTFTANQNLVLGGIDQNGGTIDGSGVITSVSTITRSGALNSVLGDVTGYNSGVLKLGTGTTTLGAANTYTGTTKVSEGTLALGANGSLATNSSAQVASGATLDLAAHNQTLGDAKINGTLVGSGTFTVNGTLSGSGTITPDTVINGTHSPGNSPGIQTFGGNLTYSAGAGILLQFTDNTTNNSPVIHDQILVGKNLNFSGLTTLNIAFGDTGSAVDWNNAFWQTSQNWTLYSVSGITTGFDNLTLNSANWSDANGLFFGDTLANGTFSLGKNGQNVVLNYNAQAVPEPSTYALMGLCALALVIAYRRKRA